MMIAVLQHSPWEGPGHNMLKAATETGVTLRVIKAWEGSFPDPVGFNGFILLGGGANVHEEDKYPFLKKEKRYIKKLLDSDKPCLGICLGHQLLANVLGATVGRNFCYSIGLGQALLTLRGRNHPVFKTIDQPMPTFKWHGQAVLPPVPHHFEILATSKECQVEAFSIIERPHIIGVQFDNHAAHPKDVAMWYDHDKKWLDSLDGFLLSRETLLSSIAGRKSRMAQDFKKFFVAFCGFL